MLATDIENIIKNQEYQLQVENLFLEDFYYQNFKLKNDPETVSHDTIYRHVYVLSEKKLLRKKRRQRKKRRYFLCFTTFRRKRILFFPSGSRIKKKKNRNKTKEKKEKLVASFFP